MTHEVRTPLNAVIGMTELLRQMTLPPDAVRLVETIHMSGEHLLALVNDLLDSARFEAGRVVLEEVDFVLRDLVEEAIEMAAATSGMKRLSVVAVIDPTLPDEVRGDPRRFGQVLANLLGNAVKFTSQGFVRLRMTRVRRDGTEVMLRVEVEDSGIGIVPDALPRLFEPFVQADEATSRRFGGTGLGLSIASGIVAAMGSRIEVDSTPGEGSRFHFEVRLRCGRRGNVLSLPTCEGLRLAVASDDAVLVEALRSQAARLGTHAVVVTDADQLWLFRTPASVAVLVDPRLPDVAACVVAAAAARLPVVELVLPRASASMGALLHLRTPVRLASLAHLLTTLRPETPRAETPLATSFPRDTCRVLAVEDNEANQQLITCVLDSVGISVDVVATGEEACVAVGRQPYDAILMDCRLPGIDGLNATRLIRARAGLERVPVIGLTASALPGTRQACLDAGMNEVLTKPTRPSVLVEGLRRWLPKERTSARTPLDPMTADLHGEAHFLDRAVVDELVRLDLFQVMLRAVTRDVPLRLIDVRNALRRGDLSHVGLLAHRLIAVIGNIGWQHAAALAGELECACEEPGRTDQSDLAQGLEQIVLAGLPVLQRLIAQAAEETCPCVP